MIRDHIVEIVEMYFNQGFTYEQIGEKYGCTKERIRQLISPYRDNRYMPTDAHFKRKYKSVANKISKLIDEGYHLKKICISTGIAIRTICRILGVFDLPKPKLKKYTRPNMCSDTKRRQVILLYLKGTSSEEIAEKIGISSPTMYKIIKESGVQMRKKQYANRKS